MRRAGRALLVVLAASLAACAGNGDPAELALLDLDGRPADPLAGGAAATVLLLVRSDCPISNRYAPEVIRLFEHFASRGVDFWLVYSGDDETAERVRAHRADYRYPFPAVRDPRQSLARRVAAKVTPEATVFTASGELVYHGRIDDRYEDFGLYRPEPTRRDLQLALEAVLAGRPVETPYVAAVGCPIDLVE